MTCTNRTHTLFLLWSIIALFFFSFSIYPVHAEAVSQTEAVLEDTRYTIDYAYLTSAYPGATAWLYQPNTTINAPIMCNERNPAYYLRHQFDGTYSSDGALFVESPADFTAQVVTIYGINRWNNTLFGSLSSYRQEEYYHNHPDMLLLTPQGDYRLEIFAGIRQSASENNRLHIPESAGENLIQVDLPIILERSFITPNAAVLPQQGDRWAVLIASSNKSNVSGYALYARMRPIAYAADAKTEIINQMEMDHRDTVSGPVMLPGIGQRWYYAQNDPLWRRLVFEAEGSQKNRVFGDGGCGPTAVAMAVANLLSPDELCKLRTAAADPLGFRFCSCSVNTLRCSKGHIPYQLTSGQEYLRYLPIAVANLATGNNTQGIYGRRPNAFGTNLEYIYLLSEAVGITTERTRSLDEAIAFLQKRQGVIVACTTGRESPFTNSSHFLVLAAADENYLYVLDPLMREDYSSVDFREIVQVLQPGVLRVKLSEAATCRLTPFFLMKRSEPNQQ